MTRPKITGLLFNCALNSALPTLLEGIGQLAEREAAGTLTQIADNPIVQQYQRIKDIFAHHYGVDGELAFDWPAFHLFVSKHSFYANEIIFAPIFRHFIAEKGLASGSYLPADLGALRDVQGDGRYNYLADTEAAELFHNHFGISVETYEFIGDSSTENPQDNYRRMNTRLTQHYDYPFGNTPTIRLYLKYEHFEIQPHESLEQATEEFIAEINALPNGLSAIHDGLSGSQNAHFSNRCLGDLVIYGHQALMMQFDAANERLFVRQGVLNQLDDITSHDEYSLTDEEAGDVDKIYVEDDNLFPSLDHAKYQMSAQDYATKGVAYHDDTLAGRQTFAVILLTILKDRGDKRANPLLVHMDNLAFAANGHTVLASYFLDQLATVIIKSKGNLSEEYVENLVEQIDFNQHAVQSMSSVKKSGRNEKQVALVKSAEELIHHAWQRYNETKDATLIEVIQQTQEIAMDPSRDSVESYTALRERVEGRGSWGKIIAGMMLSVIGFALIAGAALALTGGLSLAVPLTLPVIAVGAGAVTLGLASIAASIGLFSTAADTGLYKEMKVLGEQAQTNVFQVG